MVQGTHAAELYEMQGASDYADKQAGVAIQVERRRGGGFVFPASAGLSEQGTASVASSPESARRPGRLSPEERRTLRRQINEAGADLYTRRSE